MKPRGDGGAADGTNARAAGELRGHCFALTRVRAGFPDSGPTGAGGAAPRTRGAGNCATGPHPPAPDEPTRGSGGGAPGNGRGLEGAAGAENVRSRGTDRTPQGAP
jgi:hypothetical protein